MTLASRPIKASKVTTNQESKTEAERQHNRLYLSYYERAHTYGVVTGLPNPERFGEIYAGRAGVDSLITLAQSYLNGQIS